MVDLPNPSFPGKLEPEPPAGQAAADDVPAMPRRNPVPGDHWLCSELVTVFWADTTGAERALAANLEEIWREGAALDTEEPLPCGIGVRLLPAGDPDEPAARILTAAAQPALLELSATVSECRGNETGFAVIVKFHAGSEWSFERFPLFHAVNSRELEEKAAHTETGNASAKPQADPDVCDSPANDGTAGSADSANRASKAAAHRAADAALEQGSLFCLALHATRR
ncbi:MAG: hypothetical protein IT169_04435 [Bryobacterales bacterium]|nr:hypothetical protein [Bryobacterales bacterium]